MRTAIMAVLILSLAGLTIGCREETISPKPPQAQPSQFLSILDLPCDQVQAKVREILQKDAGLGLASQGQVERGVSYTTKRQMEGARRWSAVVLVQCFGPKNSRLSALVDAQTQKGGQWSPVAAPDIEKRILDKLAKGVAQ